MFLSKNQQTAVHPIDRSINKLRFQDLTLRDLLTYKLKETNQAGNIFYCCFAREQNDIEYCLKEIAVFVEPSCKQIYQMNIIYCGKSFVYCLNFFFSQQSNYCTIFIMKGTTVTEERRLNCLLDILKPYFAKIYIVSSNDPNNLGIINSQHFEFWIVIFAIDFIIEQHIKSQNLYSIILPSLESSSETRRDFKSQIFYINYNNDTFKSEVFESYLYERVNFINGTYLSRYCETVFEGLKTFSIKKRQQWMMQCMERTDAGYFSVTDFIQAYNLPIRIFPVYAQLRYATGQQFALQFSGSAMPINLELQPLISPNSPNVKKAVTWQDRKGRLSPETNSCIPNCTIL